MLDKLENLSIVLGSLIGLSNIEDILGIIILVFQIILILYKVIKKVIDKIKNKEYNELEEEVEKAIEDLKKAKEDHKSDR